MKSFTSLFFLATGCLFFSCNQQEDNAPDGYTITVNVTAPEGTWVYLRNRGDILDSGQITTESLVFEGELDQPFMANLAFKGVRSYLPLFLENAQIRIDGNLDSLDNAIVTGSELHSIWENFDLAQMVLREKQNTLWESYQKADSAQDTIAMDAIDKQWEDLDEEFEVYTKEFVVKNRENAVGAYLIRSNLMYSLDGPALEAITDTLAPSLDSLDYVVFLRDRIEILKKTAPGQPMIDFEQAAPDGTLISSKDFRGKYLLVDFWASWCGPCRRENPNVVKIYQDLKDQGPGFEILGVSFDVDSTKWVNAIAEDGLPWPQVSDLEGWSNAVGKLYGIQSIPHTLLVDPNGVIIEHKLRGDALRDRLSEILNAGS